MKRTQGHGNPDWSRDETILAFDLYIRYSNIFLPPSHPEVINLSKTLNQLPIHPIEKRKNNFRNPDGVSIKILNLKSIQTQKGLTNSSKTDKEIFNYYNNRHQELKEIAENIKKGILLIENSKELANDIHDNETFVEGKILTYLHHERERSPSLRKKLISTTLSRGELTCSACGYQSIFKDSSLNQSMFECHHIIPLSKVGPQKTTLRDVALLCANCHRAIHALIASQKRWIPLDEFKKYIPSQA